MSADDPAPKRVLLVEDEALVSMIAEENLRIMGFEPVAAFTGGEALQAMREDAHFWAAIVDVGLPDMRGDALAHQIRIQAPAMPIILASGYDSAEIKRGFAGDSRIRVLGKPYSEGQLRQALAELDLAAL